MAKKYSILRPWCRFSQPPTQASLFHYIKPISPHESFTGRGIWSDLLGGFRSPAFIPSVLGGMENSIMAQSQLRVRRMESAFISVLVHVSIIVLAIVLINNGTKPLLTTDSIISIGDPGMYDLPVDGGGKEGTGGSGHQAQTPASWGVLPNTSKVPLLVPDPQEPQPLLPSQDMTVVPSIELPVEIARDYNLPVGDPSAPISNVRSPGTGRGNGIGDGEGPGLGRSRGPGFGNSGEPGVGMGGPGHNGIYKMGTEGLKYPEILYDPKPQYTEDARRSLTEGLVVIQAVVRKNGSVDSFHVIQSLSHGLDESAIQTISTKWRFKPAQLNGAPVDALVNIEVRFRMF
jgi:TonB family protein